MKNFRLPIFIFLILAPYGLMAQVHCPMKCSEESFPYTFCDKAGARTVHCSTNPNKDTIFGQASKQHFPACVNVLSIGDSDYMWQPAGQVPAAPTPPDKSDRTIYFQDEYNPGWDYCDICGWDSPEEWMLAHLQWVSDSTNFMNGDPIIEPDTNNSEYNTENERLNAMGYWGQDQGFQDKYDADYTLYLAKLQAHTDGTDVPYNQIWDNDNANIDGLLGLNDWLSTCGLSGDHACPCILVKPDNSIVDFPGVYAPDSVAHFALADSRGMNTYCAHGPCPDAAYDYIIYNTTNSFLYRNNSDKVILNNDYILHPACPIWGWYTGPSVAGIHTGYGVFSFRDVVEHELGHELGMHHADELSIEGLTCPNNCTMCRDSIANYWMSLTSKGLKPNRTPRGLGPDDRCMFEKLYCPEKLGVSPAEESEEPVPPSPEVYPNPSNGGMTLTYTVSKHSFVQVIVYNALGSAVRESYSAYEEPGSHSIALGTESLLSGHYVCRVRIGDRASYLNLVIEK